MRTHAFTLASLLAAPVLAGTNAGLALLAPVPAQSSGWGSGAAQWIPSGEVKGEGEDYHLGVFDAAGTLSLQRSSELNPRLGAAYTLLAFSADESPIPEELVDTSLAAALTLTDTADWKVTLVGGAGYAGSTAFARGDAWYGLGTLVAERKLDAANNESFSFLVDYDGNRTVLPDVPLPGIAYHRKLNSTLDAIVGFPYSLLTWRPSERFAVELRYLVPDSLRVHGAYAFTRRLSAYGEFDSRKEAFAVDGLRGDDRLFFEQQRLEAGIEYSPLPTLRVHAGVGYAFSQEFSSGWDLRDVSTLQELSDEPYLRAGLSWMF